MARKQGTSRPKHDIVQLEAEYNVLRPLLAQLDIELHHQLGQLLGREAVALSFPIQHRVKAWSSIAEKLQRVPLSLDAGLRGLQDLVGFRIILQFRRDVGRVCSLIEQNLKIANRYDTVERLREDQFGYSSVHFVVELPTSWLAVPTMAGLADLRAEIQVRTTAQHIWAEASQTLQYKRKEAVPPTVQRAIYRVSALLETVDLEFERVLVDRDSYKAEVAQNAPTTESLNVDSLERVLDEAWPLANKEEGDEDYADLLADLTVFGVGTPDALWNLILKHREATLADDAQRVRELQRKPRKIAQFSTRERIRAGVFFTQCGLTRVALEQEFPDRWRKYAFEKSVSVGQPEPKLGE